MLHGKVDMLRGADAQKKLKRITQIFAVITVEAVRSIVDGKLGAESDIDAVAMRQIADVTDGVTAHRENA